MVSQPNASLTLVPKIIEALQDISTTSGLKECTLSRDMDGGDICIFTPPANYYFEGTKSVELTSVYSGILQSFSNENIPHLSNPIIVIIPYWDSYSIRW